MNSSISCSGSTSVTPIIRTRSGRLSDPLHPGEMALYGRDDMPDDFAYTLARAMDEQQHLLQWVNVGYSYNPHTVWKAFRVPLPQRATIGNAATCNSGFCRDGCKKRPR